MSSGQQIRDRATEEAFRAAWFGIRHLPERSARRTFTLIADRTYRRNGKGVQQLRKNLDQVRPGLAPAALDALVHAGVRSYMRYWMEAFRLPSWSVERVRSDFRLLNVERLDDEMAKGNGVIMVPGHLANWDLGGAWAADRYNGFTTVAERLKPEGLFKQFLAYRETLGMEVLPLGDPDLVRALARRLKNGRMVALLGDRDLGGNGIEVDFMGARATLPAGPALLSLMTGAPVLPIGLWYEGDQCLGHVYDPILGPEGVDRAAQMQTMTQTLADNLGHAIREHAQDWHVMQRVWK
ncbi:MAG: phosphatidylinositol mannoside acyltransferase [Candidatus Nanopelagicales bacterium]